MRTHGFLPSTLRRNSQEMGSTNGAFGAAQTQVPLPLASECRFDTPPRNHFTKERGKDETPSASYPRPPHCPLLPAQNPSPLVGPPLAPACIDPAPQPRTATSPSAIVALTRLKDLHGFYRRSLSCPDVEWFSTGHDKDWSELPSSPQATAKLPVDVTAFAE